MKLQVLTWTPSRLDKYDECPAKVKYEDVMHLCPRCFKGRTSGGFDGVPVTCDTCSKPQPERAQLDRGNKLDAALTGALSGRAHEVVPDDYMEATRHPVIKKLVKSLSGKKGVDAQKAIVLDKNWNPVSQYTKGAWARMKLDVVKIAKSVARIIDWKSGGIDKRTLQVRAQAKYDGQMLCYQAGVLAAHPEVEVATAELAFLDCGPKFDPIVTRKALERKALEAAKKQIEKRVAPLLNDDTFAPKAGMQCNWCDYSKAKGGPCIF